RRTRSGPAPGTRPYDAHHGRQLRARARLLAPAVQRRRRGRGLLREARLRRLRGRGHERGRTDAPADLALAKRRPYIRRVPHRTLTMRARIILRLLVVVIGGAAAALPAFAQGVQVGASDIGGVVTSSKGPEAGVWVIAETTELPTKFVKIVVTDD